MKSAQNTRPVGGLRTSVSVDPQPADALISAQEQQETRLKHLQVKRSGRKGRINDCGASSRTPSGIWG